MPFTTIEVARRLEEVNIIHSTRRVEACKQIFPHQNTRVYSISYGIAAVNLPSFGWELNHIVVCGMAGPVTCEDLDIVEKSHSEDNLSTDIDLCPHTNEEALKTSSLRQYIISGRINSYVRILSDGDIGQQMSQKSRYLESILKGLMNSSATLLQAIKITGSLSYC